VALKGEAKERASCRARCNLRFAPSHLSFPFHPTLSSQKGSSICADSQYRANSVGITQFIFQARPPPFRWPVTPFTRFYACQSNNSLDQLSALSVGVTAFVAANSEAFCHHKAFREPPRLTPAALRLQYGPQRFHERPYLAVDLTLAPKSQRHDNFLPPTNSRPPDIEA
jgi:hypothetical protein